MDKSAELRSESQPKLWARMEYDVKIIEALLLLLVVAVGVSAFCHRLKINPLLGYLIAGAFIGPFGLGWLEESSQTATLAEMGIIFLMFTIGLEVPMEKLKQLRTYVLGMGSAQVLLCGALIGGVAYAMGLKAEAAIAVGGAMALSSTAMVMQLLTARHEQNTPHGKAAFSILLLQDLAVVPLLTLIPLLGASDGNIIWAMGLALVKAFAALVIIIFIGRKILKPLYTAIAHMHAHEIFVATTLMVVLGTSWGTYAAGLSLALGAFLAGLLIAETEYRHGVAADINPFRGLLLAVFFMTVGTLVDPNLFIDLFWETLLLVAALMIGKAVVIAALARGFSIPLGTAIRTGGLLGQSGEFAFVLLSVAVTHAVVDLPTASWLVMTVIITMALTPAIIWVSHKLGRMVEGRTDTVDAIEAASHDDLSDHVIIAGFGRVGQAVGRVLDTHGIPYIALDMATRRIQRCRSQGLPVYYGDATLAEVWKEAGAERARTAVITMDSDQLAHTAVSVLNQMRPEIHIIARTQNLDRSGKLAELGADTVIPEIVEASLTIASLTLRANGVPAEEAAAVVETFRANDYNKLDKMVTGKDEAVVP